MGRGSVLWGIRSLGYLFERVTSLVFTCTGLSIFFCKLTSATSTHHSSNSRHSLWLLASPTIPVLFPEWAAKGITQPSTKVVVLGGLVFLEGSCMDVVLPIHSTLYDSMTYQFITCHDASRAFLYDGLQEPYKGRDVAWSLPQNRYQQEREQLHVWARAVRPGLQHHRHELEDVWDELWSGCKRKQRARSIHQSLFQTRCLLQQQFALGNIFSQTST